MRALLSSVAALVTLLAFTPAGGAAPVPLDTVVADQWAALRVPAPSACPLAHDGPLGTPSSPIMGSSTIKTLACTPPVLTLSAVPNPVQSGGQTTLSWSASATYPVACQAHYGAGPWAGYKSATGSQTITLTATTYFELNCSGEGGAAYAAVSVGVTTLPSPPPPPPPSPSPPSPPATGVDDASFVSQSVPVSLTAGQTAQVSVTMRNAGTTTWTAAAGYRLGSQSPQDNTTWRSGRVDLSPTDAITPGQSKAFSFAITAPSAPGVYAFKWRMLRENVQWFGGSSASVNVNVKNAPAPPPPPPPADPEPYWYPDGWYYEGNDGSWDPGSLGLLSRFGCSVQTVAKSAKSVVFRSVIFRLNLRVSWCWQYPKIVQLGSSCYASDVDAATIKVSDCTTSGYFYNWKGSPQGGYHYVAQARFSNCVTRYGCWREDVVTLQIWINGNGAWTKKT